MPISDINYQTVNVRIQPNADVDGVVNLFLKAIRGNGGSGRRADLIRVKGDTAVFHVEVDDENETIEPLLEHWHADNENSVVEIW